jgi:hypothetical protein
MLFVLFARESTLRMMYSTYYVLVTKIRITIIGKEQANQIGNNSERCGVCRIRRLLDDSVDPDAETTSAHVLFGR